MVGAKNHIFLLHLDHPGREPEKVSAGQGVQTCSWAGLPTFSRGSSGTQGHIL